MQPKDPAVFNKTFSENSNKNYGFQLKKISDFC